MAEQDDSEKSHDPTQKRLDDARQKGQIARSPDLVAAVAFGGFVIVFFAAGPAALHSAASASLALLSPDPGLPVRDAVMAMIWPAVPLVAAPAVPVLLLLVAQKALIFTPGNLAPRLSRIDPLAGAGRRFGAEGIADFLKGLAKLILIGTILVHFLSGQADGILAAPVLAAGPATVLMLDLLMRFLALCLGVALCLGGVDLLWQIRQHLVRNRMSHQELVEEHKETEGDPQARAARRQRGQDIAMNRMMADLPKADVVIVNPTHYAVALKWDRSAGQAPVCLAKGTDEAALRIRAAAAEHGIPIHRDAPAARAIFATVDIGRPIRPEHYRAVAAALRLTEAMRRKRRRPQ